MKKLFILYSTVLLAVLCYVPIPRGLAQTVWDGTVDTVWYHSAQTDFDINTPAQLAGLAYLVNHSVSDFSGKTINLAADIWLNQNVGDTLHNWDPIGGGTNATGETSGSPKFFKGNFNGQYHTIYNMYCDNGPYFQAGLFGAIKGVMTIQNLALANPIVKGAGMLGAVAGFAGSGGVITIRNCMVMNVLIVGSTGNNIGGIIGANYSNYAGTNILSCGATGSITGNYAGGFGGNCEHESFTDCYFAGTINSLGGNPSGGISAYSGTRTNCHSNIVSTGNLSGTVQDTTYMRTSAFISDLDSTFKMDCSLNNGYPIQSWQECGVGVEGNFEICYGESTTLTAYGFSSYQWNTGATTASITVSPTVTTDYYIEATDINNLTKYDTVTVTVFPQAVINATAIAGADGNVHGTVTPDISYVACGGTDLVTLTITPDSGYHIAQIVMNDSLLREDDPTDGDVVTYAVNPNGTLAEVQVFFSNIYTITASMLVDDTVALSNAQLLSPWGNNGVYTAYQGSDVVYTFFENARYHIVDVLINAVSQGPIHTYSFTDVDRNGNTVQVLYQDTCGILSLPYFDNFESYSTGYQIIPDCWSRRGASADYPYLYYYSGYSGTKSLSFNQYAESYAVMPTINTTLNPINGLQVAYVLKTGSTSTAFTVGVMTDPTDISTFTPVSSTTNTATEVWQSHVAYLSSYNGSGQYIAFKWAGTMYADACYLDNVEISLAPDCSPVQNVTVTNVTYDNTNAGSATVNWDAGVVGTPMSYTLEYKTADETDWTTIPSITDTTYTIPGLLSTTGYEVRVSSDCGTSTMSDWVYSSFAIPCDSSDMCTYTFAMTSSMSWNGAAIEVYLNGMLAHSYSQATYYAESHTFSVCEGSDVVLKFAAGPYSYYQTYMAFTLTDSYGIDLFSCAAGSATAYTDEMVVYSANLSCQPPQCTRPDSISVVGGATTAEVSWTDAGTTSQSWLIEYGPEGFTRGTGTTVEAYGSPYTLNDLDSNKRYSMFIRTFCGEGDTSIYTDRVNFRTYFCEAYDRCNYLFTLKDANYGSSFDNMQIYVGDSLYETLAGPNNATIVYEVPLCNHGDTVSLVYNARYSWGAAYASFSLQDPFGEQVLYSFSSGNNLSGTTVYSFVPDCTPPTCRRPLDVTVNAITMTTADINWTTADENGSAWLIEYDTTGFTPGTGHVVSANTMPFTLNNLTQNTNYEVYVTAVCGAGDTSLLSDVVSFVTACDEISALPYTQDFESNIVRYDGFDYISCWSRYASNAEHQVYEYQYYNSHSGNHCLDFHWTPNCYNIAILPLLSNTISLNTLRTTFYLFRTSSTPFFEIGVMTDKDDPTSFTVLDTIAGIYNSWTYIEYNLNEYQGSGQFLAFRVSNGSNGGFRLDDLTLEPIPSCLHPENLTAQTITEGSAIISWEEVGTASSWILEYGHDGFSHGAGNLVTATDTFYNLAGLTSSTDYDVYVRADCGSGDSSTWLGPISFTTECGTFQIPYVENFDTYTPWAIPDCWSKIESPSMSGAAYIYGGNSYSGSLSLKMSTNAGNNTYYAYAKLPVFNIPVNQLAISFKGKRVSGSAHPFVVGVMSGTDVSTLTILDTIDNMTSSWTDYFVSLASYTGSNLNIAIGVPTGYTDACEYRIEDVQVTLIPTCMSPVNLTASNQTASSVDLAWTERGTATNWLVEYGSVGFSIGQGSIVAAPTNPFTVTGLTAETTYDFYVRSICSATDSSFWSNVASGTTDSASVVTCTAPSNVVASNLTASGATISWTPAAGTDAAWNVEYGVIGFVQGSGTPVAVTTPTAVLTGLLANTTYQVYVQTDCGNGNTSSWIGPINFITTAEATCPMPTDLAVTAVDSNSATIAWTQEAGTATEWTLNYRRAETGATWTTSTISTNPYTILDLTGLTAYEVQIRANCPNGTFSEYTDVVSFTTTSINDYNLSNSISLYPNPTTSYIEVKFSDNIQVSELKVYDVYGKLLQTITVNNNPTRINVSALADGVYFVRAVTENGIANKSFIKR